MPWPSPRVFCPRTNCKGLPLKLVLTPEVVAAAYELLRATKPFKSWALPSADKVKIRVTRQRNICANSLVTEERHYFLSVSTYYHSQLGTLLPTVAHEMCHFREGAFSWRNDVAHSALFRRLAKQVCNVHGFDPNSFIGHG